MRTSPLILIVDDNDTVRRSIAAHLEHMGYRADVVADGEEALDAVKRKAYAAIVSDVEMPRLTGPELYEALRESVPRLCDRFVLMTGNLDSAPKGLVCPLLHKPFGMDSLMRALRSVLPDGSGSETPRG